MTLRAIWCASVACALLGFSPLSVLAESVFIPLPERRDLVYDSSRGLLYITTSEGTVERYDVDSNTLLPPFEVGNSLFGADITPDHAFLYVAEGAVSETEGLVRKVDLANGSVTNISYTLEFSELGVWDVTIGNYGKGLVSTQRQGSGWVPLRELDLSTDSLAIREDAPGSSVGGEVRQNTLVSRGFDRSIFFLTEANSSAGPVFNYIPLTDSFGLPDKIGDDLSRNPTSVNRDGTLFALEVDSGTLILNPQFDVIETLVGSSGVVFHPLEDILFLANSEEVIVYETDSWSEVGRSQIGESVFPPAHFGRGEMSVTDNGEIVFISTWTGVRVLNMEVMLLNGFE